MEQLQCSVQDGMRHSTVQDPQCICNKETRSVHRSDSKECLSRQGDLSRQASSCELCPGVTSQIATCASSPSCYAVLATPTLEGSPASVSTHPLQSSLLASSAVNESLCADIESLQKALIASAERQCTLLALQHTAACLERAQAPIPNSLGHPGRALPNGVNLGSLPISARSTSPVGSSQAAKEDVEVHINPLYSAEVDEKGRTAMDTHCVEAASAAVAIPSSKDRDKCVVGSDTPCSVSSTPKASPPSPQALAGDSELLRICDSNMHAYASTAQACPATCQVADAPDSGLETGPSGSKQEGSHMCSPCTGTTVSLAPSGVQDVRSGESGLGRVRAGQLECRSAIAINKSHGAGVKMVSDRILDLHPADTAEAVEKLCEDLHGLHVRIASNLKVGPRVHPSRDVANATLRSCEHACMKVIAVMLMLYCCISVGLAN